MGEILLITKEKDRVVLLPVWIKIKEKNHRNVWDKIIKEKLERKYGKIK